MHSPQGRSEAAVAALEMCWVHRHRSFAVTKAVLWEAVGWNPSPVLGTREPSWVQHPSSVLEPHLTMEQQTLQELLSFPASKPFTDLPGCKRCVLGFSSLQEKREISPTFRENYGFSPQCVAVWNSQALSFGLIFPRSIKSARFLAN